MTQEMLERFYVEVTHPDELGLTDARFKDVFQMARRYLYLRDRMPRPVEGQQAFWLRRGDDLDEAVDAAMRLEPQHGSNER
jgi:hypothetical protein